MKIGIIGAGHVGTTLAIVFAKHNYPVFIASKSEMSAKKASEISHTKFCNIESVAKDAEFIFLTVTDGEIINAAKRIAPFLDKEQYIAHTSGALPSSIIDFLPGKVLSIHPLKAFADSLTSAETIKGTLFITEGNVEALSIAKELIETIGGKFVSIKTEDKPLYHLSAVIISNFTDTLFNIGEKILNSIGFSGEESKKALLNLIKGVIYNIETVGSEDALTGPFIRGDIGIITLHLNTIKDPLLKSIYKNLGLATLIIADERGLEKEKIKEIRKVLNR